MADDTGTPKKALTDDAIQRDWSDVRSRMHESGYRYNEGFAQRQLTGKSIDPDCVLNYLADQYERTAKMMVKIVTDHDSAVTCCKGLDDLWKPFLKESRTIIRQSQQRGDHSKSQQILTQLHQRILPRSEHWKAEAHRVVRRVQRTRRQLSSSEDLAARNAAAGQHRVDYVAQALQAVEAERPKQSDKRKRPVRNQKYEEIDKSLRRINAARPKSHAEVFRLLEDRKVPIPNRMPFKAYGWFKGFQQDRHAATAWLSQAWRRLSLPAFAKGPKK